MYCAQCGAELKDDARFCAKCGASTIDAGDNARGFDTTAPANSTQPSLFSEQMEADRRRSRRKMSPLMIIALVLALIAGTALAAVLITSQPQQAGESASQQQDSSTAQSQNTELQAGQQGVTLIDGWWRSGSVTGGRQYEVMHIANGIGWRYEILDDLPTGIVTSVEVMEAERLDNVGLSLMNYTSSSVDANGKSGYRISITNGAEVYLLDEDDANLLNGTRTGAYGRIDKPSWAPDDDSPFDQEKAERAILSQAQAEGKPIFTGTVEIVDTATRQVEVGQPNLNPTNISNPYLAILILDQPVQTSGTAADNRAATRDVESVRLATSAGNEPDYLIETWLPYEGKTVTVIGDSVDFPTDTSGVLANCALVNPRVITPINVTINPGNAGTN